MRIIGLTYLLLLFVSMGLFPCASYGAGKDIAHGCPVLITPTPNAHKYHIQHDGTLLTDGKITPKNKKIWESGEAIGWRYAGRVNIAVNLGQACDVHEVSLRLRGGGGGPGWIEVVASQDGSHWTTVAKASRFDRDYQKEFEHLVGNNESNYFQSGKVFLLRFKRLDIDARWIGIRMSTNGPNTGLTDEIYVYGKHVANEAALRPIQGAAAGFSVTHPQPYFNKPRLLVVTNIATPLPIGVVPAAQGEAHRSDAPLTITLDIPKGIQLLSGHFGALHDGMTVGQAKVKTLSDGAHRFHFTVPAPSQSNKDYGRFYIQATHWTNGQTGEIRYKFGQGDWHSRVAAVPVRAVTMPKAPRLKTIMSGLGWWRLRYNARWPHVLKAFNQIGFNTFSLISYYARSKPANSPEWQLIEKARQEGFYISNIDSTFMRMGQRFGKKHPEMYHQGPKGPLTHGSHIDPSYRGKYYQWAIHRFAKMIARVKPNFTSEDVELFHSTPLKTFKECTRCQKLFAESGYKSWNQWRSSLGDQMWHDAIGAARAALKKEGANPQFDNGIYALRPGVVFDHIQNFDHLYSKYLSHSEPSQYGPYYAGRLRAIGNAVRQDRQRLPKSDVMPWLTPGDAGTFPEQTFVWAMLESYTNGARGIWFWSGRMWDAEDLLAVNKVVRAIAPVENIIVKGDLVGSWAKVVGKGRVSGMKHNGNIVLLVSDYYGRTDGKVNLKLNLPKAVIVRDLLNNKNEVAHLKAGKRKFVVNLKGKQARFLWLQPQAK